MDTQEKRDRTAKGLASLTKYLADNPHVPVPNLIYTYVNETTPVIGHLSRYSYEAEIDYRENETDESRRDRQNHVLKEWIGSVARQLIGTGVKIEKIYEGTTFKLKVTGANFVINYTTTREAVCRRVVKETKEIPEQYIPGRIEPARKEEVVEWVCDDGTVLNK